MKQETVTEIIISLEKREEILIKFSQLSSIT